MVTSKYFKEEEFKRCVPACSLQDMQQHTMDKLDAAREMSGIPWIMNSAFRPVEWEKARGRSGEGGHPHGCAVDIRCNSFATRFKIIFCALAVGFRRIGVGKNYIHLDDDPSRAQNVIWDYYA